MADGTLATARWAAPEEVIARYPFRDNGETLWLGRSPTMEATPLGYADKRHVLVSCGTRSGKGTTLIINNLLLWRGSVMVMDPKGECATVAATRRGPGSDHCDGMHQDVHVLDPARVARVPEAMRSRWNPLAHIHPEDDDAIAVARTIADAIIVEPQGGSGGDAGFFCDAARELIQWVAMHVRTAEEYEGRRNLVTVRDLLVGGDLEKVALLREDGDEHPPSGHALLWQGMKNNPACGGKIARQGAQYADIYERSDRQFFGMLQTATTQTSFLDDPQMARCLEASDFELAELKTNPKGVSLFVSIPERWQDTHFRWLRLVVILTRNEMERVRYEGTAEKTATGHPVLFCLDEFAALHRMKEMERAVAMIAGYGVKLLLVVQDLNQLKTTYKDGWQTLYGGCGIRIFFEITDLFTVEYVSKLLGETEVVVTDENESETASKAVASTWTDTENWSEADAVADGLTVTISEAENASRSHAVSAQRHHGVHRGAQWNLQLGMGRNNGTVWEPGFFFGKEISRNAGGGGNLGGAYGRVKGTSAGVSDGTTDTDGTSQTRTASLAAQQSQTRTTLRGGSRARGGSSTETTGTNKGVTRRRQTRPLARVDEVARWFAMIEDREDPNFPGFALVCPAGQVPMFVKKANYFEDERFVGMFDPHPDHEFRQLPAHCVALEGLTAEAQAVWGCRIHEVFVDVEDYVTAGAPLMRLAGTIAGKMVVADIRAPLTGYVVEVPVRRPDDGGWDVPEGALGVMGYFGEPRVLDRALMMRELEQRVEEGRAALAQEKREQQMQALDDGTHAAMKDFLVNELRGAQEKRDGFKMRADMFRELGCVFIAVVVALHVGVLPLRAWWVGAPLAGWLRAAVLLAELLAASKLWREYFAARVGSEVAGAAVEERIQEGRFWLDEAVARTEIMRKNHWGRGDYPLEVQLAKPVSAVEMYKALQHKVEGDRPYRFETAGQREARVFAMIRREAVTAVKTWKIAAQKHVAARIAALAERRKERRRVRKRLRELDAIARARRAKPPQPTREEVRRAAVRTRAPAPGPGPRRAEPAARVPPRRSREPSDARD